jgi:GntR family transcriptional regulator, transcriptional repressor for pyruvate dehydrogenase complex
MSETEATSDAAPRSLVPIVAQKATDLIAEQIRSSIFAGEFRLGELLPAEGDLSAQTGSSRASVRGALRMLETQGFIQMRPGRSGGAIVRMPGQVELEDTVNQLIRSEEIGLPELLGMQEAIEPRCAQLAALSRSDLQMAGIESALEAITNHEGSVSSLLEAHSRWHVAVSRASNNELLSGLMVAVVNWIHTATQENNLLADPVSPNAYVEVTAAIRRQDPDAAFTRMNQHVVSRAKAMTGALRRSARPAG